MRVTLDWDTQEEFGENFNVNDVRQRPLINDPTWELRQSSSGDGYHYIEYGTDHTWEGVVNVREEFGDDPKRLRLDKQRFRTGSPFIQVLYTYKYINRPSNTGSNLELDLSTGNKAKVLDGVEHVPESERVKTNGVINYEKLANVLVDKVSGTQSALADRLGVNRSTVHRYVTGKTSPREETRDKLRRIARYEGVAHYANDKSLLNDDNVEVIYTDDKVTRRTLVEYADAPWDSNVGGDDREYALLNVHTGTFNENKSRGQLVTAHDKVMKAALDRLSPTAPDGNSLDLDRINKSIHREKDSINYEEELLDVDEKETYLSNMTDKHGELTTPDGTVVDADKHTLFEIILWDEDMDDMIWQVIGGYVNDEFVVLKDSQGWF